MRPLKRMSLVVFDCDSTLTAIEGIDELGGACRDEIRSLTDLAMRGEVPLEAVYGRRLDLIRPDRVRVEELARRYVEQLVPDAADVVAALQEEGIAVRILSGGLLPAVTAVADALNIARVDVAAVGIHFERDGSYAGFDSTSPLARARGKCDVLDSWRRSHAGRAMLVGDGATDLEAASAVDVFVAYTGVVARSAVAQGADAVIRSQSLAPVLPLALGGELPSTGHAALFERGLSLLEPRERSRLNT